jgi:cytochrome P450
LLLVAGIDTTWSAIGSAIWYLAGHAEDQRRLREDPGLWLTALEELLRAFAPVTMAREVVTDTSIAGCPIHAGDPLLLPFPAANRDPDAFERPDEVLLDRAHNRHLAFGVGIHRCLGSTLARMEIMVSIQRLLARLPPFRLADPDAVEWSTGQVRGPRVLPIRF